MQAGADLHLRTRVGHGGDDSVVVPVAELAAHGLRLFEDRGLQRRRSLAGLALTRHALEQVHRIHGGLAKAAVDLAVEQLQRLQRALEIRHALAAASPLQRGRLGSGLGLYGRRRRRRFRGRSGFRRRRRFRGRSGRCRHGRFRRHGGRRRRGRGRSLLIAQRRGGLRIEAQIAVHHVADLGAILNLAPLRAALQNGDVRAVLHPGKALGRGGGLLAQVQSGSDLYLRTRVGYGGDDGVVVLVAEFAAHGLYLFENRGLQRRRGLAVFALTRHALKQLHRVHGGFVKAAARLAVVELQRLQRALEIRHALAAAAPLQRGRLGGGLGSRRNRRFRGRRRLGRSGRFGSRRGFDRRRGLGSRGRLKHGLVDPRGGGVGIATQIAVHHIADGGAILHPAPLAALFQHGNHRAVLHPGKNFGRGRGLLAQIQTGADLHLRAIDAHGAFHQPVVRIAELLLQLVGAIFHGGKQRVGDAAGGGLAVHGLIFAHRRRRGRVKGAVLRAGIEAQSLQRLLQADDLLARIALHQSGCGRIRGEQPVPQRRVHLAVGRHAQILLVRRHGVVRVVPKDAVGGGAQIAQLNQAVLQLANPVAGAALFQHAAGSGKLAVGLIRRGEGLLQEAAAQRAVALAAVIDFDLRARGAVVRDPLRVLHTQANAAMGRGRTEIAHRRRGRAGLLGTVCNGMEEDAAADARRPLGVAAILAEIIPFRALG